MNNKLHTPSTISAETKPMAYHSLKNDNQAIWISSGVCV